MAKEKKLTDEDKELLSALGVNIESKKIVKYTPREERIIAGFEEIQKFVEEKGHLPVHGEDKNIFERLYAVRLDQIRKQNECKHLLKDIDYQNLLEENHEDSFDDSKELNDDELLSELGIEIDQENSLTKLKHVKPRAEKKAAEEIANRKPCDDFKKFKPLFESLKKDLSIGMRKTIPFRKDIGFTKTHIKQGQFLIIGGQIAYIANIGQTFKAPNGEDDARLRVIYSNAMESDILLRSIIRAMYKDETSRFITDQSNGPLFTDEHSDDDQESGTIYVLRSLSEHPVVKENRNVVHKIGVTGGEIKKRLANAKNDPTFLMDEVEIVATYKLANINRVKLENLIHKFFSSARIDIEIIDRFGKPIKVREWFLLPIFVIDEMVEKLKAGTLGDCKYDPQSVKLIMNT